MTLNFNLTLPKVGHGKELTLISFMKNLAGKFFTTRGGLDVFATFISFEMIRGLYTYTLRQHKNVIFITICAELMYMN